MLTKRNYKQQRHPSTQQVRQFRNVSRNPSRLIRVSKSAADRRPGLFIESWFQLLFCYEYREILAGL
jgi:hypothetical protein